MDKISNWTIPLYHHLTGGKTISDALLAFTQLSVTNPSVGDEFFESFGVGNTQGVIDRPFERFACYEFLLQQIKSADEQKFTIIHKGTPYYFLAWLAFDTQNYEKAVYYLDIALAEDLRKSSGPGLSQSQIMEQALRNPVGGFFILDPDKAGTGRRVAEILRSKVENQFTSFRDTSGLNFEIKDLREKFVRPLLLKNNRNRSLISTLYSFIYEFRDNRELLILAKQGGCTLEPFLLHLFKGGLIFESLLRLVAEERQWSKYNPRKGLGQFADVPDFLSLFNLKKADFQTTAADLTDVLGGSIGNDRGAAFSTTTKIRNTVGHDLRRNDIFNTENYHRLFQQETSAIFFIISDAFVGCQP